MNILSQMAQRKTVCGNESAKANTAEKGNRNTEGAMAFIVLSL